jgi:transcriptional regulator with PAS, ATPase and Fis domain
VRELESIMERGVALANGDTIELAHLPEHLKELGLKTFRKKEGKIPSLEEQEMTYIKWVLNEAGGNKTLAAQILGIDRSSGGSKIRTEVNKHFEFVAVQTQWPYHQHMNPFPEPSQYCEQLILMLTP